MHLWDEMGHNGWEVGMGRRYFLKFRRGGWWWLHFKLNNKLGYVNVNGKVKVKYVGNIQ